MQLQICPQRCNLRLENIDDIRSFFSSSSSREVVYLEEESKAFKKPRYSLSDHEVGNLENKCDRCEITDSLTMRL